MSEICKKEFSAKLPRISVIACILLTLQILVVVPLEAQKIAYCGIEFRPDKLQQVDADNYHAQIGKDEALVSEQNLGLWLVRGLIRDPQRLKLTPAESLANYLESCPRSLEPQEEQKLLEQLLSSQSAVQVNWHKFFARNPENIKILKSALKAREWQDQLTQGRSEQQYDIISSAVFNIFLLDSAWLITELPRTYHFFQPKLVEQAKEQLLAALDVKNLQKIENLEKSLAAYGKQDFNTIVIAARLSSELISLDKTNLSCQKIFNLNSAEPEIRDIVYPLYRDIILDIFNYELKTSSQFKAENFSNISDCLVRIDSRRVSPQVYAVIASFLNRIAGSSNLGMISTDARSRLASLVTVESGLQQQYEVLLKADLQSSLDAGQLDKSFLSYSELRQQNSTIASGYSARVASLARKQGKENLANQINPEGDSKIMSKLISTLMILVLVTLIFYILRLKRSWIVAFLSHFEKTERSERREKLQESDEDDFSENRSFVRVENSRGQSRELGEYQETLKKFSLQPNASLKDIKSAYRQLVKNCHPDLNPNQSELEIREFLELTKVYDRLIELRVILGKE